MESLFLKRKNNRRFAARYEKNPFYFHAIVCITRIFVPGNRINSPSPRAFGCGENFSGKRKSPVGGCVCRTGLLNY